MKIHIGGAVRRVAVAAFIIMIIFITGCSDSTPENVTVSDTRFFLDTFCTITIDVQNNATLITEAESILEEAFSLIEHYEALFSITAVGSDIWRINHAGGAPTSVSPETVEILEAGIYHGRLSDGKFDITIGRLTRLWDFSGQSGLPDEADLRDAAATVDYRTVSISGNTVTLENSDTMIDLGGIAKGFMLDRLGDFLRGAGVSGAVIDLGGDVSVVGQRPHGGEWRIGVRQPFARDAGLLGVITTSEAAIITSGVYERRFEYNDISYHHILDPQTGMPVASDIISATIVTKNALYGDALTSVVLHVGSVVASDLLQESPHVIGALLVLRSGEIIKIGDVVFEQ